MTLIRFRFYMHIVWIFSSSKEKYIRNRIDLILFFFQTFFQSNSETARFSSTFSCIYDDNQITFDMLNGLIRGLCFHTTREKLLVDWLAFCIHSHLHNNNDFNLVFSPSSYSSTFIFFNFFVSFCFAVMCVCASAVVNCVEKLNFFLTSNNQKYCSIW